MHLFYYLLPEEISSFRERETRSSCNWHKRLYESPVLIMQVICMRRKYPYTNVLSSEELLHIRARTHKHAAWTRFRIIAAATLSAQEVIRRTIDFWERIYGRHICSALERSQLLIRQPLQSSLEFVQLVKA